MPACKLFCERCGSRQLMQLQGADFALFLNNGVIQRGCSRCEGTTGWKLALPPGSRTPQKPGPTHSRILVIEDEEVTRRFLEHTLESGGYLVSGANHADRAVELLQEKDFDIVISDIRMPDFDGRMLFRFLAVLLPLYVSRIVFLTADRTEETLHFLQETGCLYAFKPIDKQQLLALINRVK